MRQKQLVHFNEGLMAMFLKLRLRYTWYTDTHLSWTLIKDDKYPRDHTKFETTDFALMSCSKLKEGCHSWLAFWTSVSIWQEISFSTLLKVANRKFRFKVPSGDWLLSTARCKNICRIHQMKQSQISIFIALKQNYCQYLVAATLPFQKQSFNLQKFAQSVFCCNKEH